MLCRAKGAYAVYSIDDSGLHWVGTDGTSADDLLGGPHVPHRKADAVVLLKNFLSDGPKPANDVFTLAAENGFTSGCIRAAGRSLGVQQKPSAFRGQWLWSLPSSEATTADTTSASKESLAN
jgi:hypothetical protein